MTLPVAQSDGRAAKTTELQDLLARVEGATGEDWVLDTALWDTLVPDAYISREGAEFTASLDAALALCERVLPGWNASAILLHGEPCEGHVWERGHVGSIQGKAATPALALLAALLRALIAQTPTPKNENRNG